MGACASCLFGTSDDYDTPDPETRRRQQAEAAERRQKENESRGIKDPEGLKRKQQRKEELEKKAELAGTQQGEGLKWQVG
ncbi:small vcp/p97-interacting protein-like [Plakobranchus ocellatus]|uniref:Small vcp/p97-interacting protein-like n=1 Tax=Plakobranchus ocellatus TaxID=259542 RepID=A0AAV3XZZ5_9GAST|nr:small vcp/p97-interacting protein-like [Plakobranchus ocellatus]